MLTASLSGSATFTITADACTGTALGPGKSCNVMVQFAPTTAGQTTAALAANGKKPPSSASITLTGTGSSAGTPNLVLSLGTFLGQGGDGENRYDYHQFVSGVAQTFTVTNNGTGASNVLQVIFGGNTGYSFSNNTCEDAALAPGAHCTFDLTFTAPGGCNPGDSFPEQVDVFGSPDHYIHLDTQGYCPP